MHMIGYTAHREHVHAQAGALRADGAPYTPLDVFGEQRRRSHVAQTRWTKTPTCARRINPLLR
jgi:hypothetical protein